MKTRRRAAAASLLLVLSALAAGAGASVVSATDLACTINGTPGDDVWEDVPDGAVVCGGKGNDWIVFLHRSNVTFYGGHGNDFVLDWIGNDNVFEGGPGNDGVGHFHDRGTGVFYGGQGADTIDTCHVGTFYGGNGTDVAVNEEDCVIDLGRQ